MPEAITDNLDIWTSALLTRSTAGRGSNGKLEAYGIKKLRELIYELAAKGLLVDAASDAAAKTAKIGDVADLVMGQAPPGNECNKDGVGTIFVKTGEFGDLYPEVVEWTTKPLKLAKAGDVLICVVGATVGKLNLAIDSAIGRSVAAIRPHGDIDTKYLYFSLMPYTLKLRSQSRGSAQGVIGKEELNAVEIRLPLLKEQNRIVEKVDELMSLCDQLEQQQTHSIEAHKTLVASLLGTLTSVVSQQEFSAAWALIASHFDTLFATEASIDQLKQTILQLAVMGKLVPQDPHDEPASVLLEKIANEKERLIEESKLKKQKPLPVIGVEETLFDLPEGWAWARLQDVIDVRDGTHDSPKDAIGEDTYPLVTSKNFINGEIDFDGARRISAEDHVEISKRSLVEKYDILFSMIGGNLGNQVMVLDDRQFSVKNVALFKYYNKDLTSPYFVKKFMEHLALDLQGEASGGAQPFVSLGFLRSLVFGLPPCDEQERIVAKVDELMVLCDSLKARLADAQANQLHLADAIVEQAVC